MNLVRWFGPVVAGGALIAAACGGNDDANDDDGQAGTPAESTAPAETASPAPTQNVDSQYVQYLFQDWPRTDPATLTVPPREILKGCPGPDCIPALDVEGAVEISAPRGGQAKFAAVTDVAYDERLPVAFVNVNGAIKGYPLHIMTRHEIVNDVIGGVPVAVTFCPLCNTALSFDRRVDDMVLDFGVSGNLRNSDLIMFDRQTESWWQQAIGEAIAGPLAGKELKPIATSVVSFGDFAASFPDALILTEETGFGIQYGFNPYEFYDRAGTRPFLFQGEIDPRLDGLERVIGLEFDGEALAVPYSEVGTAGAANVVVGSQPVAVLWAPGTVSVLDTSDVLKARDIGAAAAYNPVVDGQVLTFASIGDGLFRDEETGSTWMVTGVAIDGPLAGTQLEAVTHTSHFWFAWAAFYPETEIWTAS
ncbi:MAG: DUF3179 domain-containing protein [Dehalococcoidia bacterium]